MKKTLLLLSCLSLAALAQTPPESPWAALGRQADAIAAAIRARDTHALHQLDAAIGQETAGLRQGGPGKALDDLLADIARQASAAHHDGHAAQWDEASAAQARLAADLGKARSLLPARD